MMKELTVETVKAHTSDYILIDVREADELKGPEGFIVGSHHIPLGPQLIDCLNSADPKKSYVFICRSGCRSGHACEIAESLGFQKSYNMIGGMLAWQAMALSEA